jgi:hypothetical protein
VTAVDSTAPCRSVKSRVSPTTAVTQRLVSARSSRVAADTMSLPGIGAQMSNATMSAPSALDAAPLPGPDRAPPR